MSIDILSADKVASQLQQLDKAWTALDNDYLIRVFTTPDFETAVTLVNRIAAVAEAQGHHPDIALSYGKVECKLSTHDVAGITQKDFLLAQAIDHLTNEPD